MTNLPQSLDAALGGHRSTTSALVQGIRQARNAVAQPGMPGEHSRTAGAVIYLRLDDAMGAHTPSEQRSYGLKVTSRPAGEVMTLSSEIMCASRVIQAGARLIPIANAPAPVSNNVGVIGWYAREAKFIVVKPAAFATVAAGANVAASALPIVSADINMAEAAAQAVTFKISRDTQKSISDEVLQFELERAIVLGLAQLADKVLLDAVAATNPANWSLALAAASGARFAELRAIVGRSGVGGTVNATGDLVAGGLPSELTDQAELTFAGVFSRSAVACEREIRILLKRTDLQGSLDVTIFVNLQAVLPSPATFWKVAA
jgi:hypothetical protein